MNKKLRYFAMLLLMAVTSGAWAQDATTIANVDFTSSEWTGKTFSQGNTTTADVINGLYFYSKNSNSDKQFSLTDNTTKGLTFPNNNMSSGNYYFVIPLDNINGSITVTLKHSYSSNKASFKYVFIDGREEFQAGETGGSGGTQVTDANSSDTEITFTVDATNAKGHLCIGRQSSNYTNILGVTVTTPASDGITNLVGAWSDAAPTFAYGATATIPTFSVTGGTIGTDYSVAYSLVSGSNVTVDQTSGITAIDTQTAGTSVVKATITVINDEEYKATTAEYTCTITVNEEQTTPSGDEYKITFNGKDAQTTAGYFSWPSSAKHNFNTKFNGCSYDGTDFTQGLKMEGSTQVDFTSTTTATVEIVQSDYSTKTIKFDGKELAVADATAITGGRVYTITDVAPGTHSITRGDGESGIFQIKVTYTGAIVEQLPKPEITFDATSGEVTITASTNATSVVYTTDGSTPTADNGTAYDAPFVVADGTTVQAIAIGDGTNYATSQVASEEVILSGVVLATPVISQYNGTVAITTTSPSATIMYSFDGIEYFEYNRAFTVFEDATIFAKTTRPLSTDSEVATATITAIPESKDSKMLFLGYDNFAFDGKIGTGKDDFVGYTLTMVTEQDKSWGSGSNVSYKDIENSGTLRSIKGSNGAQAKLTLPEGVIAKRVILYSYVNNPTTENVCGWSEFNGSNVPYTTVPMGAFSDKDDYQTNPDVRVFPLTGTETEITFNNAGRQLCFVIGLEVEAVNIKAAGYATYTTKMALDFTDTGVKAFIVDEANTSTVHFAPVTKVPAGTAIVVKGDEGKYIIPITSDDTDDVADNLLKTPTEGQTSRGVEYCLANKTKGVGFYPVSEGVAIKKAYLIIDTTNGAPEFIGFLENGGTSTGISTVAVENAELNIDAPMYNIAGQRVSRSYKGVVIQNGKKFIVK